VGSWWLNTVDQADICCWNVLTTRLVIPLLFFVYAGRMQFSARRNSCNALLRLLYGLVTTGPLVPGLKSYGVCQGSCVSNSHQVNISFFPVISSYTLVYSILTNFIYVCLCTFKFTTWDYVCNCSFVHIVRASHIINWRNTLTLQQVWLVPAQVLHLETVSGETM